jgi:hypothetical protein
MVEARAERITDCSVKLGLVWSRVPSSRAAQGTSSRPIILPAVVTSETLTPLVSFFLAFLLAIKH